VDIQYELALCHQNGAENFEVVPRFVENICTPVWY